jgi:Fe-S-cluster containining protein
MFEGIEQECRECDKCCFTYGWILSSERQKYKNICDLVDINNELTTFDSYERDVKGERIVDIVPRCKFYKGRSCQIHSIKPFDCLLYPVKVIYSPKKKEYLVVMSKDCPYVKSFIKRRIWIRKKGEIKKFFDEMDKNLRQEYFLYVKQWTLISKPKNFKYLLICKNKEEDFLDV